MNIKNKKSFWRSYFQSIVAAVLLLLFIIYPYSAMYFNPPPIEENTKILFGKIINAQQQFPHILLQLDDGVEQYLNFPGSLQTVYVAKYPDFYGASKEDLARLNNCIAVIKIDHLKGLIVPTSPRIWSVQCKNFSLSYGSLYKYYLDSRNFGGIQAFIFGVCIFFLVLMIRTDSIIRDKS